MQERAAHEKALIIIPSSDVHPINFNTAVKMQNFILIN